MHYILYTVILKIILAVQKTTRKFSIPTLILYIGYCRANFIASRLLLLKSEGEYMILRGGIGYTSK
jgi:hypothetical protein